MMNEEAKVGTEVDQLSEKEKREAERKARCAARSRDYYKRNREKLAAYHRQYVIDHKEQVAEYQRKYHKDNHEKLLESKRRSSLKYDRKQRQLRQNEQSNATTSPEYSSDNSEA